MQVLIIADDLTGAADTLGAFASSGWSNRLLLQPPEPAAPDEPDVQALSLTTNSRDLTPQTAAACVREAVAPFLQSEPHRLLYKKIDSTLRGPIGAELHALMQQSQRRRVLVAPAFPAQGRTTVNGWQRVHGEPLTPPLPDLLADVCSAEMPLIALPLAALRQGQAAAVLGAPMGVFLADAQTPQDLVTLATAACDAGFDTFCGSAGLAYALASLHPCTRTQRSRRNPEGPCLLALGSRNAVTLQQVEQLRAAGLLCLRPDEPDALNSAQRYIRDGRDIVLTTAGMPFVGDEPQTVAAALAALVRRAAEAGPVRRFVLCGGDIALAVCRALDTGAIEFDREVEPGLPLGRLIGGAWAGTEVVTKPGGFGREDSLLRAIRME